MCMTQGKSCNSSSQEETAIQAVIVIPIMRDETNVNATTTLTSMSNNTCSVYFAVHCLVYLLR